MERHDHEESAWPGIMAQFAGEDPVVALEAALQFEDTWGSMHAFCVGQYLELSWGTPASKAQLCSHRRALGDHSQAFLQAIADSNIQDHNVKLLSFLPRWRRIAQKIIQERRKKRVPKKPESTDDEEKIVNEESDLEEACILPPSPINVDKRPITIKSPKVKYFL
ncbi:hypothetical protein MC885_014869 [Smutsia gigantea]|nr:hypothetical protein MC885_014869 [Smutsia gigantea]